ncbi:MAG: preprotein translocase subunit SecG, partial [Proteobacteria bacterium]|nr:preprotein translocase subunit SecG [Pseudomonadota bacterium]
MQILVTIVHVIVCIVLVLVVLLQAGKGANMGAVFGGSSQTIFGSSGPGTFLGKMTTIVAIIFMLTSFSLSYTASRKGSSLMEGAARPAAQKTVPAPEAPPVPTSPTQQTPAQKAPTQKAPAAPV